MCSECVVSVLSLGIHGIVGIGSHGICLQQPMNAKREQSVRARVEERRTRGKRTFKRTFFLEDIIASVGRKVELKAFGFGSKKNGLI